MNKALATALAASTCLLPLPALAQADELAALRARIAELEAQLGELATRLDEVEAEAAVTVAPAPPPAPASAAAAAPAPAAPPPVQVAWRGAPEISAPGGWSFKPRGRLMFDAGFTSVPASTGRADGFASEGRRMRLGVEGRMPGNLGYRFELDFAGGGAEIYDAFITHSANGLTLKAGQHNNFQSLDELTSSNFHSFIERAAFTDAFGFERRLGVSAEYRGGDILLQGGLFTDNLADLPGRGWGGDVRAVYLPKLGDTQLHLGASAHHADLAAGDTVRYRQRPLVHFTSERFIDTGNLAAGSETGFGAEAAVISGPFHAAAETFWQSVDRPGALSNLGFFGGYAEIGYFLTGEQRGYRNGVFDRTSPANPLGDGGAGAWQINLRYDHLDLGDAGISGGRQNGYMASLVWIPTSYTRLLLNYARLSYSGAVHAAAGGDRSYSVDSLGVRAQIDF